MHSAAHQVVADGPRGRRPSALVPPVLAGFRAEVDNIETATVRVPQRLRHILLVRPAASARACAIGVLAGVRWLSHQLGNGCQLAEQIPGPWQLFQTLQFGCSLLETRCGERIARGNALSPAALSKVLGVMRRHRYASCWVDADCGGNFTSRSANAQALHW